MTTSIQSLGGKARAANMTPEERTRAARHAATKGARKLGKEGRRLRALKGVATRKARAEAAQKWGSSPAVEAEIDATAKPGKLTCFCKGKLEPVDGFEVNHSPKSCGWIREGEPGTKAFFEAGRKAGHRLADNFVNANAGAVVKVERCSVCLDVARVISVDELMRLQTTPECVVSVEGNKVTAGMCGGMTKRPAPRRPLPKAGTMSAKVLDVVRLKGPILLDAIEDWIVPAAPRFEVRNALSSLRSAGHVVSVEKPGSRREKLWRLA